MRVLFDNGTPRGLARFLANHSVEEARARGGEEFANGEVINAAEQAGFDVLVTTDKNIALVVLEHSQWPMVKLVIGNIVAAVNSAQPGSYQEVEVPFKDA
jgi:predicted nuclease of predicted toxin-antitoxin system